MTMDFVEIPPESMSREALDGLIEEFVTRDGTDYGIEECALEMKKSAIMSQIDRRDVVIVFDPQSQTCNIIAKEELSRR